MLHHTATRDAHHNHAIYQTLTQWINEFHDADQQQLQQIANTLRAIINEQRRMNEELQDLQDVGGGLRPLQVLRTLPPAWCLKFG